MHKKEKITHVRKSGADVRVLILANVFNLDGDLFIFLSLSSFSSPAGLHRPRPSF